jgi:hypothetical protein
MAPNYPWGFTLIFKKYLTCKLYGDSIMMGAEFYLFIIYVCKNQLLFGRLSSFKFKNLQSFGTNKLKKGIQNPKP